MIFISHATKDDDFVNKLRDSLRRLSYTTFIDHFDIHAGSHWDEIVEQRLETSKAMIVVLSPDAIDSRNVKAEWRIFHESNKPIIPVIVSKCRIPLLLRVLNHVDFTNGTDYETCIQRIVASLPHQPDLSVLTAEFANLPHTSMLKEAMYQKEREHVGQNVPLGKNQILFSLPDYGTFEICHLDKEKLFFGWMRRATDTRPDIDLSRYEPEQNGISQQHALISKIGDTLTVVDIGSVNGTFVDGKRLNAYSSATLKNGMRIRLGNLNIMTFFEVEEKAQQ